MVLLLTAVVLMFVYRLLLRPENVTFKQSFAIVLWAFLIVAIVTIPLLLGTMALKGAWNEDPGTVIAANLAPVLDRASTPKPLYVLAKQLDLFGFWLVWLLASGFRGRAAQAHGLGPVGRGHPGCCWSRSGVGWAAIFRRVRNTLAAGPRAG